MIAFEPPLNFAEPPLTFAGRPHMGQRTWRRVKKAGHGGPGPLDEDGLRPGIVVPRTLRSGTEHSRLIRDCQLTWPAGNSSSRRATVTSTASSILAIAWLRASYCPRYRSSMKR
jgi:hypothetical protein